MVNNLSIAPPHGMDAAIAEPRVASSNGTQLVSELFVACLRVSSVTRPTSAEVRQPATASLGKTARL